MHLLRVLHALLTECSVSNAARRLNQSQPAVSTALRRLRDITGDPLLVRSRNGMTPPNAARRCWNRSRRRWRISKPLACASNALTRPSPQRVFNIATPDYLNAILIGWLVARLRALAPHAQVALHLVWPRSRLRPRAGIRRAGRGDWQLAQPARASAPGAAV